MWFVHLTIASGKTTAQNSYLNDLAKVPRFLLENFGNSRPVMDNIWKKMKQTVTTKINHYKIELLTLSI